MNEACLVAEARHFPTPEPHLAARVEICTMLAREPQNCPTLSDPEETATDTLSTADTVSKTTPAGTDSRKLALLQQIPDPLISLLKSGGKNPRHVVHQPERNSMVGLEDFVKRDAVQRQKCDRVRRTTGRHRVRSL